MKTREKTALNKNAVIYARFSSHNQREESIEQQVAECKAFAKVSKLSVVSVYADSAKTGKTDRRPQFQKMQRDAAKGEFDTIIAYKSNRIARNMYNALVFENNMAALGVSVLYAKEEFGNNAAGRFALRTMMNVNQFFSENMAEDIKRNQADNASNCRANGPAPYGYRTGDDGKFEIDPEQAAVVKEIFDRIAAGEKLVTIADDFNRRGITTRRSNSWGKSSFSAILHNERYTGVYIFEDVRIEGGMPEIIDRAKFDEVQKVLKTKKNPQGRKKSDYGIYLLTGKLFCGKCGSHMIGMSGTSKSGDPHYYYVCNEKRTNGGCDKKAVRRDYIEKKVAESIKKYILQGDVKEWIADQVLEYQKTNEKQIEIETMRTRRKEVQTAIGNVLIAIDQGIITSSTKKHLEDLESEQALLNAKILVAETEAGKAVTRDSLLAYLDHFQNTDVNDKECQKELFDTFVKSVYLFDDHIIITFDFVNGNKDAVEISTDGIEEEYQDCVRLRLKMGHQEKSTRQRAFFACCFPMRVMCASQ